MVASAAAVIAGVNSGFTLVVGALIGVGAVAAMAGYGRSVAGIRAMGLGFVVVAIAVIQLAQLWNDGLDAPMLLPASILAVVAMLGTACLALGRHIEAAGRP